MQKGKLVEIVGVSHNLSYSASLPRGGSASGLRDFVFCSSSDQRRQSLQVRVLGGVSRRECTETRG